ncbi:MAG: hypothetical protein M0030_26745 [Actinomycetota bacterium]|nr:hypothetical protein [Actinomycetota bacterium]
MQRSLTTPSRTAPICRWPRPVPAMPDRHVAAEAAAVPAGHDRPGGSPWPVQDAGRRDRPGRWLAVAMAALGVLAAASAVVSFAAQYRMVLAAKGSVPVAGLEAGIPDVAALIFATLGIALALHARRAIRARFLNVGAVATSLAMNVLAAGHGWRDLAIWVMPPVAYALASDTAIGVVRAWAIARQKALDTALADDGVTPLAIVAGLLLWLLRLLLAPVSTLAGFRAWVLAECPVAPGHRARQITRTGVPRPAAPGRAAVTARSSSRAGVRREGTKTARFLALAEERHGPLAGLPLARVGRVSAELAPEAGLHPGAARTALRRRVQALQNGTRS